MKKLLIAGLFLGMTGFAFGETTFMDDTKRVVVSTAVASPTQLFTAGSWRTKPDKSYILNDSGFNLFLSTSTTGISTSTTTGNFFLPSGNTIFDFRDFAGALYGVISGTDQPKAVGILRTK